MSDHLPFGAHVLVAHRVEPRYLKWHTTLTTRHEAGLLGGFRKADEVPLDPPVLGTDRWHPADFGVREEDIGEPCSGSTDIPERGTHRRLRRFPEETSGLVVGWVWRAEGSYREGYVRAAYDGEPDDQPPYLAESGRIRLYQVAVDPGEVGQRFFPARIVLAHPDDVREVAS